MGPPGGCAVDAAKMSRWMKATGVEEEEDGAGIGIAPPKEEREWGAEEGRIALRRREGEKGAERDSGEVCKVDWFDAAGGDSLPWLCGLIRRKPIKRQDRE